MEKGKLVDLIGVNLDGYTFGYCHAISIDQAGLLPAAITRTGGRVIVVEEALVGEILAKLPERTHHVEQYFCLYNVSLGLLFRLISTEADDAKGEEYIDRADFNELVAERPDPFHWPT